MPVGWNGSGGVPDGTERTSVALENLSGTEGVRQGRLNIRSGVLARYCQNDRVRGEPEACVAVTSDGLSGF